MKVRTEARRDAILEVASQVFLEMGFERASIAEIVKRIGGSKSTIYGYFPSKESLFLAVTHAAGERHMAASITELQSYSGQDLEAVLVSFSVRLLEFLCSAEAIAAHRMVMGEAGNSDIGTMFYEAGPKRGLVAVAELFERAIAHGQLQGDDPWVMAQYFASMANAEYQHRWFLKDAPPLKKAQIRQTAERAVGLFLRAFSQ